MSATEELEARVRAIELLMEVALAPMPRRTLDRLLEEIVPAVQASSAPTEILRHYEAILLGALRLQDARGQD
jgi:hypothetical protein